MSDVAAAPEAAEPVVAPPSPVSTEREPIPEAKPEPKAEPGADKKAERPSTRDALKAAVEKVNEAEKAADKKPEPVKAEAQGEKKPAETAKPTDTKPEPQNRAPDGKFAPRETAEKPEATAEVKPEAAKPTGGHNEAPSRFSTEAKAAWATAPEAVRAETHRAIRELEAGFAQHREAAQAYETFRPYAELAKKSGLDPAGQLANYVAIDQLLARDFTAGLDRICQNFGTSLRQVVQHLSGQPANAQANQSDALVRELRQEIASLKQQVGGFAPVIQRTQQQAANHEIEQFRGSLPEADRHLIDDLDTEIGSLIANNGLSLPDAFAKAKSDAQARYERMFGGSGLIPRTPAAPAPAPAAPDLAAQTLKGSKSITGAPGSGSDPAARKPSSSTREALRRALNAVG